MGVERYVIEAVVRDGRSHREVARSAGVSKAWVTKLLARYREGGDAGIEPRSRRPKSCAHAASPEIQAAIVALRQHLDTRLRTILDSPGATSPPWRRSGVSSNATD
jgi:transposase